MDACTTLYLTRHPHRDAGPTLLKKLQKKRTKCSPQKPHYQNTYKQNIDAKHANSAKCTSEKTIVVVVVAAATWTRTRTTTTIGVVFLDLNLNQKGRSVHPCCGQCCILKNRLFSFFGRPSQGEAAQRLFLSDFCGT